MQHCVAVDSGKQRRGIKILRIPLSPEIWSRILQGGVAVGMGLEIAWDFKHWPRAGRERGTQYTPAPVYTATEQAPLEVPYIPLVLLH